MRQLVTVFMVSLCVLIACQALAKEKGSRVQNVVWVEFEGLPDGFLFSANKAYVTSMGEDLAHAWNVKPAVSPTKKYPTMPVASEWWTTLIPLPFGCVKHCFLR